MHFCLLSEQLLLFLLSSKGRKIIRRGDGGVFFLKLLRKYKLANNIQKEAIKTRIIIKATILSRCYAHSKMRDTVNDMIFRAISGMFHVKNSIPYLYDYSLRTSCISPQMYLGISYKSRQKFTSSVPWATDELQSISLCPTQCWLVTWNWLQIFSSTFALKKQFH